MDRALTAAPRPWLRAVMAAAVGVALALLAHTSVDGALPSVPALVAALVVVTVLARLATGAEVSLPVLLPALTAVQLGLHAAFLYLATGRATHTGTAGWLCCGGTAPIHAGAGAAGMSRGAIVLLVTHLLAVAVTAVWLRRLEVHVWRAARAAAASARALTRALLRALAMVVRLVVPEVRPQVGPPPVVLPVPASVLLTRRVQRRGPPVVVGC